MEEGNGYMEIRENRELNSLKNSRNGQLLNWWLQVLPFISFLLVGSSTATLLTRFYYDSGGNSVWIATIVQSAGFPILIPLFLLKQPKTPSRNDPTSISTLLLLYLFFGMLLAAVNVMYAYGLMYLPVSTYSLICASQLAFNAIFSFLLNSQKFTVLILNSLFLLTASASLLAVDPHSDDITKEKYRYITGIVITVCASGANALSFSLLELSFKKLLNKQPFDAALEMQFYQCFITTCVSTAGLVISGEWETLPDEMQGFVKGGVYYVMTLFGISVGYQMVFLGLFGLIFQVSSLFSILIATISVPIVPVLGVIIFHDRVDGVKIIALLLAIGGFLSYIYQHYLDDVNSRDSSVSYEDPSA